jgi:hypothetical protein
MVARWSTADGTATCAATLSSKAAPAPEIVMPPREKPNQRDDSAADVLPTVGEDGSLEANNSLSPDGGVADHPIHDEPTEDMGPEDFEALIDEAEKGQLERRTDDETIDPRADEVFAPGSSEPLDQQDRPLTIKR